jgi:serine/threonine-protein kinase
MEYVDGGSLADRLKKQRLSPAESVAVFDQVLEGLEVAHKAGIIHRDIKPANILLTIEGTAKLADFDVAQDQGMGATESGFARPGVHPGSVHYMSPEQVRGASLDARSDLYSLAAAWYEALAGHSYLGPRTRGDFDVRLAIVERAPRPLENVPAWLEQLIRRCLRKEPELRPASAQDVRHALRAATAAKDGKGNFNRAVTVR